MRVPFCFLLMSMLVACSQDSPEPGTPAKDQSDGAAPAPLEGAAGRLPAHAGPWARPAAARRITAETIFDYMDGAGELYLAYRFDHLDLLEYKATDPAAGTILVELYQMESPDDAFGLLSTDWTGEAVDIRAPGELSWTATRIVAVPTNTRARYGAGLLRMACGPLYARVLVPRSPRGPGSGAGDRPRSRHPERPQHPGDPPGGHLGSLCRRGSVGAGADRQG